MIDSLTKGWKMRAWLGLSLLASAILFHLQFSFFGLNPTDDGFILAGAARILDGQIPHRDFISIRPAGSYFLHASWLGFTEGYTLLINRLLFWLILAAICYFWISSLLKVLGKTLSIVELLLIPFLSLMLLSHHFPPMIWHTIDGFFFLSLGLWYILHFKKQQWLGYFFLGMSVLFRQNFILAVVPVVLILHDRKVLQMMLFSLLPAVGYLLYLQVFHALGDMRMQLFAYPADAVFQTLIRRFIQNFWFIGGLFSGLLLAFLHQHRKRYSVYIFQEGFHLQLSLAFLIGWILIQFRFAESGTWNFTLESPFFLTGILIGFISWLFHLHGKFEWPLKLGVILGWSSLVMAISLGYNTPALAAGLVFPYLYIYLRPRGFPLAKGVFTNALILSAAAVLAFHSFQDSRREDVYRDKDIWHLKSDLSNYIEVSYGILSNENLLTVLEDLEKAKAFVRNEGLDFTVAPHFTTFWANEDYQNPLAIDWPQNVELVKGQLIPALVAKSKLENTAIILQDYDMSRISEGILPLAEGSQIFVSYIKSNFTKVFETTHHSIYVKE